MSAEDKLIREIEEQAEALARALATAEQAHAQLAERSRHELDKSLADLRDASQRRLSALREEHARGLDRQTRRLKGVERRSGIWTAPWDSPELAAFRSAAGPPTAVRFGSMKFRGPFSEIVTPALLPFTGGRNLVVKSAGALKETAASGVEALVLRLLMTVPPGKLKLLLIDPVGLGRHVASLMTLKDYDETLVTGKVWVGRGHIEQQLAKISEHMETVIQGFLRGERYESMEDYNREAGEVAEAYRLVVAVNFPVAFSEQAARQLTSIALNGPRCGVLTLVTVDTSQSLPRGFEMAELERDAVVIEAGDSGFTWQDRDFRHAELELDRPPPPEQIESLLEQLGEQAKTASRVEVPFERMLPARDSWWSFSTQEGLQVAIGRAGAREYQRLELGDDSVHALTVGQTGSGKTNLMHVIITALSLHFSPDELELYLVDFKEGIGFKAYSGVEDGRGPLPHARVIAIESEREFGLSCLEALDREMGRRGDLFRETRSQKLTDYRRDHEARVPRILMLVDEFHRFFEEDDAINRRAAQLLGRIAKEGRAFGIHMLLATQTLGGSHTLPREIRGQMSVRIALRCGEADSALILAEDNLAARLLSRPGDAIYNAGTGLIEDNKRFQVAWLDDEERDAMLDLVAERFPATAERPPAIVFEGNVPARLGENDLLRRQLGAPGEPGRPARVGAWLGRPVAIKDPTAAVFAKRAGRNLLVVGREEELAVSICVAAMVSLAAQIGPDELEFDLLALPSVDSPWAALPDELAAALPHRCSPVRRRQIPERLGRLAALVDERVESEDTSGPLVFLVGLGLQRARQLRAQEPSFDFSADRQKTGPSPHRQLARILVEGPEVGVHTIGWWDSLSSLGRAVDRSTREEFGIRVALPLADDESSRLLDSPAAAKLGRLRALLWDEDQPGTLEKFIPYSLAGGEWLDWVSGSLAGKWSAR